MANEQNPQAGGSYTRNADGTLTKQEAAQPAEQPAEKPAATEKGAK